MTRHPHASQKRSLLKNARLHKNWSQKDLACQLQISPITVNRWEQGVTAPSPYYRQQLCTIFEQTSEELGLLSGQEKALSITPHSDPEAVVSDPTIPPPHKTPFPLVGREQDLEHIVTQLCSGQTSTYALTGLPGVGKTSLAVAIAHHPRIQQQFCHGILWAGLGSSAHLLHIMERWGKLLGITDETAQTLTTRDDWARWLHQHIGNRRFLLLLDDVWHDSDIEPLLLGGVNCVHLITTRFPTLAYTRAGQQVSYLHELGKEHSFSLLQHFLPASVLRVHADQIHALVSIVGGLPLAIVLMGHHLQKQALNSPPRRITQTLHQFRSNLQSRLHLSMPVDTWKYRSDAPLNTTTSLFAAIHSSFCALPPADQDTLSSLAVFPPKPYTFSEAAALAIIGTSEKTLDDLVDTGLLETSHDGRYQLHQSIIDYIHIQREVSIAELKLVEYVLKLFQPPTNPLQSIEQELPLLLHTLELALSRELYASVMQGCLSAMLFAESERVYSLAESVFDYAQQAAQYLHHSNLFAHITWYRGRILEAHGAFSQAETVYTSALQLARESHDKKLQAQVLVSLGGILIDTETSTHAEQYLIQGLQEFEVLDDHAALCTVFQYLGELANNLGEHQKAWECYQKGLHLATKTHNWKGASALLQNLGVAAHRKRDNQQARFYYLKGLQYARDSHDVQRQSALLMNLGMLAWHEQKPEEAIALSQESLDLARDMNHQMRISSVLQNLGMMLRCLQQEAQAEAYLQESLALAQEIGHRWLIAEARWELGNVYLQQQQVETAKHIFTQVYEQGGQIQAPLLQALALFGQAQVAVQEEDLHQARFLACASQDILQRIDDQVYLYELRRWQENVLLNL